VCVCVYVRGVYKVCGFYFVVISVYVFEFFTHGCANTTDWLMVFPPLVASFPQIFRAFSLHLPFPFLPG